MRTVGVAVVAVLNYELAGEAATEQGHQVVDISIWRVHNEVNSYLEKNRVGFGFA